LEGNRGIIQKDSVVTEKGYGAEKGKENPACVGGGREGVSWIHRRVGRKTSARKKRLGAIQRRGGPSKKRTL